MPKRKNLDDVEDDYCKKKRRKIERIIRKIQRHEERVRRHNISDSSESDNDMQMAASPAPPALLTEIPTEPLAQYDGDNDILTEMDTTPIILTENETIPSTSNIQKEQSTEAEPVHTEIDEEILNLLGQTPSKERKFGTEIQNDLASHLEQIATIGLTKDPKKALMEKHLIPKNCTKIDAPKLNPEIKAALSDLLIKKDKALENKQKQIAAAISGIGNALSRMFSSENRDQGTIRLLIEAIQLLCDAQHSESMTRRSFICSTIKKEIKDHLYNADIDRFLFGEKLADTLKAAKAISKSGAEIKIPTKKATPSQKQKQSTSQSLNQKPPLPPARQAGGAGRRMDLAPAARPRQQQPSRQPPRSQQHQGPRR